MLGEQAPPAFALLFQRRLQVSRSHSRLPAILICPSASLVLTWCRSKLAPVPFLTAVWQSTSPSSSSQTKTPSRTSSSLCREPRDCCCALTTIRQSIFQTATSAAPIHLL